MYICCALGLSMGVVTLNTDVSYNSEKMLSLIGLGSSIYFLVLGLVNDFRFLSEKKGVSLSHLLHQFPEQRNIYRNGIIGYVTMFTGFYIVAQLIVFGILSLFELVYIQTVVLCIWGSVLSGVIGIFVLFAQVCGKRILGIFSIIFYICVVFTILANVIPVEVLIYFHPKSFIILLLITTLLLGISIIFGKYCYRTRHELNEKMRFKRLH